MKVDLTALGGKIGASGKLSLASPEILREILGVEPGAVRGSNLTADKIKADV